MENEFRYLINLNNNSVLGSQIDAFMDQRNICWFSCGAASAVMTKIVLKQNPNAIPVYCDTGSEHEDNVRFLSDCEKWFEKKIIVIKSKSFENVDAVIAAREYMSGVNGAPCTVELKKVPRMEFQLPDDIHYFGYTIDEWKRARNFSINNFELNLRHVLIYNLLTKEDCLGILKSVGIKLPYLYTIGLEHNNCIGCVKAASLKYWAVIRQYFPVIFMIRCEQSRKYGVKLIKIKGERRFLDELPPGIDFPNEPEESCDFLCSSLANELKLNDERISA